MPYVLKHRQNFQIATDTLVNLYDLAYYGTKYWEHREDAEAEKFTYLKAAQHLDNNGDTDMWELMEIEESQMKIYNVKLKNDPSLKLFLDEQQKPFVSK